ncbi:MAG: type IV secretory system conjugative DNA transfer family protein [Candidatus Binataceae bacterium]
MAAGAESPDWRDFLSRCSIPAEMAAPAALLLLTVALLEGRIVSRITVFIAAGATLFSAVLTAWTQIAPYYPAYPLARLTVLWDGYTQAGFCLAFVATVFAIKQARKAPPAQPSWQRSPSSLHGNSEWMPMSVARRMFQTGGIIIGEAYRPDQDRKLAGKAPLLRYNGKVGSGHCLVFAGSGGYKTTGVGVPSALEWRDALVYLDPSAEVCPMVRAAREAMGHRVISLDPEHGGHGFNVLDWIDTCSDRSLMDIQAVVAWLAGEQPGERYDDYFKHAARSLLGCVLADILFAPDLLPEERTLALLRRRVTLPIPELRQLLEDIYAKGDSYGFGFPAQIAGNLKDITEKQFSGFYGEAGNLTAWLAVPSLARLVCGSSFETKDLLSGRYDVFINVPLKVLQSNPQVCRVVVGALLNAAYEARGNMAGRILFLLDEVARLGYMGILETARDAGRKYGINLLLMFQSLGQMTATWGTHGRQAWFDSSYLKLFACIHDVSAAEFLSKACGEFTAVSEGHTHGSGTSTGATNTKNSSTHETTSEQQLARRLIKPEEILQTLRYDEQIVLISNCRPLRCGRAIYFRRPEMASRTQSSRFEQLSQTASR